MSTVLETRKLSSSMEEEEEEDADMDRFINLPDTILVKIVSSLMSFKEAARTCILSKQWKHIWRSSTNIEFHENPFISKHFLTTTTLHHLGNGSSSSSSSSSTINKETRRRFFVDYVQRIILSRQHNKVDKFHLSLSDPQEFKSEVENWIRYVIFTGEVKDLELDFSNVEWNKYELEPEDINPVFDLPSYVYDHELFDHSLKLSACNVDVSKFTNLTNLKNLSLEWIELTSSSLQILISNCKALKSLTLKKCRKLDNLDISEPGIGITRLEIEDCSPTPLSIPIRISIPTLKYFKYFGSIQLFDLDDLSGLETADLDFGLHTQFDYFGDDLCEILHGLRHTKVLTVCTFVTQVLPCGEEPICLPSKLDDVKHLILKTGLHSNELPGIAFLFISCPRLEKLSIQLRTPSSGLPGYEPPYDFTARYFWRLNLLSIDCLRNELKEVQVEGYKGYENEVRLLQYLLKECRSLEKMTIFTSKGSENFIRSAQRYLLTIERASRNVVIAIH